MKYYPIFLDIKGRNCLVVGGGPVGARKAATLADCGANVIVVSERISPEFEQLAAASVSLKQKKYEKEDVQGMFLVFAATNNKALNQRIQKHAAMRNIICNVADAPDVSDFLLPSLVNRGDLIVAVSTCGSSPAMAKKIRQDLEKILGPEYEQLLVLMGNIRKKLLSKGYAPDEHKKIFNTLIEKGMLELIRNRDEININSVLHDVLGKKYSYQDLVCSRSYE